MVELNPTQQMRLENVAVADKAWRKVKLDAHVTLKKAIDAAIAASAAQRDLEVRLAFEAGVPKSRINREGLGTTNPGTVTASLARTLAGPEAIGIRQEPEAIIRYTFVPENEDAEIWTDRVRVHMDGAEYEAWKAGEGKKRFRGNAADRNVAEYAITPEGGLGLHAQGERDSSTVNTYDLAVGGWLQTHGKAEVEAWIADNVSPTEKEHN